MTQLVAVYTQNPYGDKRRILRGLVRDFKVPEGTKFQVTPQWSSASLYEMSVTGGEIKHIVLLATNIGYKVVASYDDETIEEAICEYGFSFKVQS